MRRWRHLPFRRGTFFRVPPPQVVLPPPPPLVPVRPWRGLRLRRGAQWVPSPPVVVTGSAAGVVTPVSLAVPAVRQAGSWWQLLSVRQHAREEFDFWASHPPPSCPRCGEPLINTPTADSGSGAELFCRYDGWQYPRDWVRPMLY